MSKLNEIVIVIPNGFVGQIKLVKDTAGGVPPACSGGDCEYVFPQNGILNTSDDGPLFRWRTIRFKHVDGSPAIARFIGVTAGSKRLESGVHVSSSKFDGTEHVWEISK